MRSDKQGRDQGQSSQASAEQLLKKNARTRSMPVSKCGSLLVSDSLSSCNPDKSTDCVDCMERSDADAWAPAGGNSCAPAVHSRVYCHLTCPSTPLSSPALAFNAHNGAQAARDSRPQLFIADSGVTAANGLPEVTDCT